MKALSHLANQSVNTLALIFLLPPLFGFIALLFTGSSDRLFDVLGLIIMAQVALQIIYTNSIALSLLAEHGPSKPAWPKKLYILTALSCISALALYSALLKPTVVSLLAGLILLPGSELARNSLVARIIIRRESPTDSGVWLYLSTVIILLYPLLGIWALQARIMNIRNL